MSNKPNKMLIDATHPEETRVVVVRGNRVEEFDFESAQRKQLRGNIYLAKVTRVEPSLQAAFIEYGGNRHGFLAFSEIHPDYYQIPVADRQALIEADERAHREAEEEPEDRAGRRRSRNRSSRRRDHGERVQSAVVEDADHEDAAADATQFSEPHGGPTPNDHIGHQDEVQDHDHPYEDDANHDHHEQAHDGAGHDDLHGSDRYETDADGPHESQDLAFTSASDNAASEHRDEAHDASDEVPVASNPHAADFEPQAPDAQDDHAEPAVLAAEEAHEPHDHHEAHDHDVVPSEEDEDDGETEEDQQVESVGGDDALEEVPERAYRPRRQYKIQEVIKRRQVMLVQVVKEERGNKGAALTTYLSLAGRYAVLMPNTARGGGISRKITSAQDRLRLKEVVQDLDVPEGMGVILRTAGASRTKPEIKRDFEYLIRMWETVRDVTLRSQAPTLVYEEGSLIKRSLRDLYSKEIDEIQVAGDAGYQEARDFMKMLMPSNVRAVKPYRDCQPLFSRNGVESQLDAMFSPTVQLRSGGYIVINQTEALVSIDVNSGRSTREHHIKDTALKTNLEAAEEVARQLRLRDLAGLIVIDFIDMDEKRNNRAVERKLSDCLRHDRARIQVGRISHFGLLEMSRQRIRASMLESSTEPCPHCGGTGHVRSVPSVALQLLRSLEETLMKGATHNLVVRTRTNVALYVLNQKRGHLRDLERSFKVGLSVIADPAIAGQQSFVIDRGEQVHTLEAAKALLATQLAAFPAQADEVHEHEDEQPLETEAATETGDTEARADEQTAVEAEGDGRKRKRRRPRRERPVETREDPVTHDDDADNVLIPADFAAAPFMTGDVENDGDDARVQAPEARAETPDGERRPRRRGRRGGRRRRGGADAGLVDSISDELGPTPAPEVIEAVADFDSAPIVPEPQAGSTDAETPPRNSTAQPDIATAPDEAREEAKDEATPESEKAVRRRSTVREKVSFTSEEASPVAPTVQSQPEETAPEPQQPPEESDEDRPRRAGWWSRRFGSGG
ncbi:MULTISPECIES: ribonuclease E/G [unclassified Nitrobacter]|uniref:Rne/Rng family ribonuclease n=1 Tax=unclassified Nitrobacter TaxID=2620411 RepID=UPI0009292F40|nr:MULTISPECIES: Rne/Rng family ribonuclease [unclassified Nitrobacter]MBN9147654.1 Rne/Rng family ribonuclease [Nitrobacter sp.]OJV01037.1 MAG: ribonuclease [Nitrobacter sp. 62-23]